MGTRLHRSTPSFDGRMDGDVSEMLEEFVSGPLVTWMETLESLTSSRTDQTPMPWEKKREESPKEYFLQLVGGDFLVCVMEIIDLIPGGAQPRRSILSDEVQKLQRFQTLLQRLNRFYQEDLQQLILTSPPNIYLLARDPLTTQGIKEMRKLLLLLLGGAVQCEQRDEIIGRIQTLDINTQAALASAIQEVTQEPENMLRLQWKEMAPLEMERLLRDLVPRVQDLVHERDQGLEKLWELQLEQQGSPQAPPTENGCQRLGVQLAETRAQMRRLQFELEQKMEELLDQQEELKDLEGQLHKLRQENRKLMGEARLAGLYQDELDAFREKALRTERLQAELAALRERLPVLEQCRAQLKEEREFSQALLETKAMLEGQLEALYARGQHLNQLEKEKEKLQSCLQQTQEERDQLYHQTEELLRENLVLERQLRKSLGEPLDFLRAEELESDWAPDKPYEVPEMLSYEVGRLPALERENQELRRRLQEALEKSSGSGSLVDPQSKDKASDFHDRSPKPENRPAEEKRSEAEGLASETGKGPALAQEAMLSGMEKALSEARAALREAEQKWEAEALRASGLEERLRSLQEIHAKALEKLEREREQRDLEAERLVQEVQALEREQEALQAGAQALQAVAAQAECELAEARRTLQDERLQGAQRAQKARQAEEDTHEAQRELEALQRSLEQHKLTLAQLEVEKGALEEALGQADSKRRQLDKDDRRMKAQMQAQEEALATQSLRLVQLESQSRQQVMELNHLQNISQRVSDLERENSGLKEELEAKHEALTVLEKDLQREKAKGEEAETTLAQLREQLLRKEEVFKEEPPRSQHGHVQSQELPEGHAPGKKLEEDNSALKRQLQELHALNRQLSHDLQQAKSSPVGPLSLEEPPVMQSSEGQKDPAPHLPSFQTDTGHEALNARFIELEHRNAALQAEKLALMTRAGQLESQVSSLQGALLSLQGQNFEAKEESGRWQKQNSMLQVETASLQSQKALLDSQVQELRQRLAVLEADARRAQQEREEWRGRYEALLRDHDRLTVLHERQGADLEGLLGKHAGLKGALRSLEQEHRELQGRHSQLLGQKAGLEQREEALRGQEKRLKEAEHHHQELTKQHSHLTDEHERVKQTLAQMERAQDDLQGELCGLRNRMTGLQLEQARWEAENGTLKEQNQQLDTALGRLSTQCELLAQLKGNQEEENRHLLQEIQALGRENRRLLEHSMESREQFQEEQRQYLDKLGELRREKQKLVEKIMDQYRVLEPALPRGKKSNWITEKLKKLRKPRREAPREQLRATAEGAGSNESLTGQEGVGTDGAASSAPSSPAPLHKASSVISIPDSQQAHFRRQRLSSRMLAVDSTGPRSGEGLTLPRQRFRQRRLGMLGGSHEEAAVAAAEWQVPSRISTSSQEERGPPLGEEEPTVKSQL